MQNGDGFWEYQETATSARLWKHDRKPRGIARDVKDIRALGTLAWSSNLQADDSFGRVQSIFPNSNEAPTWSESRHGDAYRVRAEFRDGAMTWFIDSRMGWNADRVVYEAAGRVQQEVICELRDFGGVWFPVKAEYFRAEKSTQRIMVRSADFSPEAASPRFTPQQLGLEPGVNIVPGDFQADDVLIWNGDQVCTGQEWGADLREGVRRRGPIFEAIERNGGRYEVPI
jgi:hypothetical protein